MKVIKRNGDLVEFDYSKIIKDLKNVPNTQCGDCNAIFKQPLEVCPKCGSHNMTQWTRVIGFLRPIKGFSKERYIEALKRTYTGPTEFTEI